MVNVIQALLKNAGLKKAFKGAAGGKNSGGKGAGGKNFGGKGAGGGIVCHKCGKAGHKAPDCRVDLSIVCHKCGSPGHKAPDCRGGGAKVAGAVRVAGGMKVAGGGGASGVVCHKCGKPGHKAPDCRVDLSIVCHKCGSPGHKAPDCRGGGVKVAGAVRVAGGMRVAGGGGASGVVCHKCGKSGHKAPDCRVDLSIVCHKCGQAGHKAPDCRQGAPSAKIGVKKMGLKGPQLGKFGLKMQAQKVGTQGQMALLAALMQKKGAGKGGAKKNGAKAYKVDKSGGELGEFTGEIKKEFRAFGFIECGELAGEHGDIFLHKDMKKNYKEGQTVKFTAVVTAKGKVQAINLKSGLK